MTTRIEFPPNDPRRYQRRDNIANDLWDISYINYSVFMNLVGAYQHLAQPVMLSVGNFYTHLASACDLAEEFLLRVCIMIAHCRGDAVPELDPDTKEQFLAKAGTWYEEHYTRNYRHYHQRGRDMLVRIGPREGIICRYVGRTDAAWTQYARFSGPIRAFRNRVVHDVQLGTIRVGSINLMPRPERVGQYARIDQLQAALSDPVVLKRDFAVREEQMFSDFRVFQQRLNELWQKPADDLRTLLYDERNNEFLRKYDIAPA
jgi:hypothetical protein